MTERERAHLRSKGEVVPVDRVYPSIYAMVKRLRWWIAFGVTLIFAGGAAVAYAAKFAREAEVEELRAQITGVQLDVNALKSGQTSMQSEMQELLRAVLAQGNGIARAVNAPEVKVPAKP